MTANSCLCWSCIPASNVGIVENMGQFEDVIPPGCHTINCCTGEVKGLVSLKVQIIRVVVQCPCKGGAIVTLTTNVMYKVIPSYVHTAFYSLAEGQSQVHQFVQNALRAAVPRYTTDELFLSRTELAETVKEDLVGFLGRFGQEVTDVLVLDIEPRGDVKQMYSQQMTQRYTRMANGYKAEANKIELVKKAEADAEVSRLNGIGMAEQRKVITGGLTLNLHAWQEAETNGKHLPESEILATMMMLQYFDMINSLSKGGTGRKGGQGVKPSVVFVGGGTSGSTSLGGGFAATTSASASTEVRQRKKIIDDSDL